MFSQSADIKSQIVACEGLTFSDVETESAYANMLEPLAQAGRGLALRTVPARCPHPMCHRD